MLNGVANCDSPAAPIAASGAIDLSFLTGKAGETAIGMIEN
jgi:hypothetical protein